MYLWFACIKLTSKHSVATEASFQTPNTQRLVHCSFVAIHWKSESYGANWMKTKALRKILTSQYAFRFVQLSRSIRNCVTLKDCSALCNISLAVFDRIDNYPLPGCFAGLDSGFSTDSVLSFPCPREKQLHAKLPAVKRFAKGLSNWPTWVCHRLETKYFAANLLPKPWYLLKFPLHSIKPVSIDK